MPREMEHSKRGKRREHGAPSARLEERLPEHIDIDSSSVRGTISTSRTYKKDPDKVGATSITDKHHVTETRDSRRRFPRIQADQPADAIKAGDRFDMPDCDPVLDDSVRTKDARETSGNTKRRYRLKFAQEEATPQHKQRQVKYQGRYLKDKPGVAADKPGEISQCKGNAAVEKFPGNRTIPSKKASSAKAQGRLIQSKKTKRRLMFEDGAKQKKQHSRGAAAALPVKAGVNAALHQAHKKVQESEHENVGVEAAHKGGKMAERGIRSLHRRKQSASRRKAGMSKLKQKGARLNTKAAKQATQQTVAKAKTVSRAAQKRRIRRQYAKAAREAGKAARRAKMAGSAAKSTAGFIRRHPAAFLVILLIALVVIVIVTVVSAFSGVASEGTGAVMATSYLAPDGDIDAAELAYTEWETDLQIEINNVESARPGYDEYRYSVDDIGHGAHELMAYLTAVAEDFRFAGIEADLRGIFDEQYQLTYSEETETRTETRTIEAGEAIGQVRTTAYCHCSICNGKWAGEPTASGVMPKASHTIAVDANNPIVPMGTKLVINGVIYTVEDTGSLNANNSDIDIFFNTHAEAMAWGRQNHTAYLAEGSGNTLEVTTTYEVRILNVTLAARSFTDVIWARLDEEQMERYNLLVRVKGNRQYTGSPFDFNWLHYVADGYGWRAYNGGKDLHKGMDIVVASGTEIIAAHGGTVTFAGNSGDYGLVVFIEGEKNVETRYAHCSEILVAEGQSVAEGDTIARVGNTGSASASHLHFEVLKNGQHLNPLYFAITNDDGSSYVPPGSPGGVGIPDYPGAPMDNARFAAMMEEAQKHLGKPYVFGASGPNSFDCSGFVSYVLSQSVYPGFGRTTAQGLYNICTPVSKANAQPGDLIFFTGTYNAGRPVTHVGIFIGNGQMIHAGKPVQYSSIDTPYWTSHFYSFGRLPG